jgi:hypothetical protein
MSDEAGVRELFGVVTEVLPSALYRVRLDEGRRSPLTRVRVERERWSISCGCSSAIASGWNCRRSIQAAGGRAAAVGVSQLN